jgi:hypothetical protein
LEPVISVQLNQNLLQGETDYKTGGRVQKRLEIGEFQAVEVWSENKSEEKRLGIDLLTEFV